MSPILTQPGLHVSPFVASWYELWLYYTPEVRRGKYLGLGVLLLQYFLLVKTSNLLHYNCVDMTIDE